MGGGGRAGDGRITKPRQALWASAEVSAARLPVVEALALPLDAKWKAARGLAAAKADWVKVLGTNGEGLVVLVAAAGSRRGREGSARRVGAAAAGRAGGLEGPAAASAAGVRRAAESAARAGRVTGGAGRPQRVHWVARCFYNTGSSKPVSRMVRGGRPLAEKPVG